MLCLHAVSLEPVYVICSYVTPVSAFFIIVTNIFELWCIRKLQRSKINPLINFIKHLSLSDLMVGIMIASVRITTAIETSFNGDNFIATEVKMFFVTCLLRFSLCASVFIMTTFAVTKMITVRQGYRITRSTATRACAASWLMSLIVVLPEYILYRLKLISRDNEKYRILLYPIVTFLVCVIFTFCYCAIYKVLRNNTDILAKYMKKNSQKKTFSERATMSDNSFAKFNRSDTHLTEIRITPAFRIGMNNSIQSTLGGGKNENRKRKRSEICLSVKRLTETSEYCSEDRDRAGSELQRHKTLVRNRHKTIRRKNKRKLIKIAVMSLAAYMVCWIPYSVVSILEAVGILQNWKYGRIISSSFANIAFWNSIVNPAIFFVVYFQQIRRLNILRW